MGGYGYLSSSPGDGHELLMVRVMMVIVMRRVMFLMVKISQDQVVTSRTFPLH